MSEVKGQGRPLFLGFILLVLFWVQLAHGQRKSDFSKLAGGAKFSLPPTSIPPVFSSLVPIGTPQMTIDVARRSIINAALDETYPPDLSGDPNKANEEESLSFPPFPRVWTERSSESTDGYSAHATANLPIFYGTTAGLKMSKQFKYSVKTTFVIVASDPIRKSQAGATPQVRQVDGFEGGEQGILVFDSNSMHAYPNVSAQMQMVGMCSFEVSLSNEFLVQAGVNTSLFGNTIGGGSSTESGKSEVAKTTRFSRFMKLDRSISVDSYLNTICMDEF
ncbi:MAG: hypothetical protein KDD35_01160, partial [Bdellovibrionales bacterium]|nr:hypothetical protein [Bdellovibrionales bacterium]